MKITTISYKRVKNLGSYQTETLEMTAEVNGETPEQAANQLKTQVESILEPPEKLANTPF